MSLELVRRWRNTPPLSISRLLSSSAHLASGSTFRSRLSTLRSASCLSWSRLRSRESDRECTLKSRDPFRECPGKSREAERGNARSDSSSDRWRVRGSSWMVLESLRRWRDATRTREFLYCESTRCRLSAAAGSSGVLLAELSPDVTPDRNPLAFSADGNSSNTVTKSG